LGKLTGIQERSRMIYRGRFAPSPTGSLHFGSLVAAVGSYLRARSHHGVWIVRMEDLDPPREVPGAATDILATLAAFGMESDEPVRQQSACEPAYAAAFATLRAAGHAFPCWCSRADLEAHCGLHRDACVAAADPARAPAWRVRAADATIGFDDVALGPQAQNLREAVGDFVIRRVEGWYAYQLAVVVDDADQGITEVVRGADLLDSTPRQMHLQRLLGLPAPAYLHLPLALDADGRKLSKQDRARPVDARDPLPALRAALRFLGQRIPGANTVAGTLKLAAAEFDLAALRAVAQSRACTIGRGSA
jgi:glutamyl-Q tRNA(Asp) synthetase